MKTICNIIFNNNVNCIKICETGTGFRTSICRTCFLVNILYYLTFIKSNLFSRLKNQKIDLVMANLPYLDQNDLKEPSIKKEPWLALAPNLYPEFFRQVGLQTHVKQIIYEDKQGIHLKNLFLA